jgi:hypothetical protein
MVEQVKVDVVEINTENTEPVNDTEPVNEHKHEEPISDIEDVKPTPKKTRAKAKAKPPVVITAVPVVEELKVAEQPAGLVEDKKPVKKAKAKAKQPVAEVVEVEEVVEVVEEKDEVQATKREKLKERTSCPECGVSMTLHTLLYNHKLRCKSVKTETIPPSLPQPPQLTRTESTYPSHDMNPTPDQIASFLRSEREQLKQKKSQKYQSLIEKTFK